MTDKPKHMVNFIKVWSYVGIDHLGHFWSKGPDGQCKKYWILIFADYTSRGIYLELLPSISAKDFLLAFLRFCNRHAIPDYVYSDQGSAFVSTSGILESSLNSSEFRENLERNNIKHIKINPFSPWIGSYWERLNKSIKSSLYKAVGKNCLDFEQFRSLLTSITEAINSRPLSYISENDEIHPITPNSFIKPSRPSNLILRDVKDQKIWLEEEDRSDVAKVLELQEECFEEFKKLWHEIYLLNMREFSRKVYQDDWTNRVKIGDVVSVKHPTKPRPFWSLGRVVDVLLGFDNKIRTVRVKLSNGRESNYSICHLYPLELGISHPPDAEYGINPPTPPTTTNDDNDFEGFDPKDNPKKSIARPKRKAADKFMHFMQENLNDL